MAIGTIAKALELSNLMSAQNIAHIDQMQANQSLSNSQVNFGQDSVENGEKMAKLAEVMQWIQVVTMIVLPLTLGAGFLVAGSAGALETAVSLSSAGAQIAMGSATAGTQSYKSDLDSQMAMDKSAIHALSRNIKTNFDSISHESEAQIKVGSGVAQMIINEGQIGSQKIRR